MPIYEYRCTACGHELEAIQKFADAPLTDCPTCHKADLVKLVSAAGFQLKGSGSKPAAAKPAGDAKTDAKSDTASDAKTESKAESKTEATPAAAPACGSGACSSCS